MTKKDELAILAAQTVLDYARQASADWDAIYVRFYSPDPSDISFEFTYRKGRDVKTADGTDEHRELLRRLLSALFDEAEQQTGARPLVAVVEVHADRNYDIRFDYDDPAALDISLAALGLPNSYFPAGEIDIPEAVKKFQRNMAARGQTAIPIFGDPRKE